MGWESLGQWRRPCLQPPVCGVQPVSILCAGLGPVLWGFQGKDRSVSLIEACDLSSSLSSLAHEAYLGK